jgi:YD repeat-containing protein
VAAIRVNRTVPRVKRVPLRPVFSASPTEIEIFAARVFEEPLVVAVGYATPAETAALARAIRLYQQQGAGERTEPFEALLAAGSIPAWRASVLLNLGLVWVRTGHMTRALSAFAEAWAVARSATTPRGRAVADRAVAELVQLLARIGRVQQAKTVLAELEGRGVGGTAKELLQHAREGLQLAQTETDVAFRCGPIALERLLGRGKADPPDQRLLAAPSTPRGTTLRQLHDLARDVGHPLRMVKRVDPAGGILVPALVHWSVGHFAAVVKETGGRYLVTDPVFNQEMWLSRKAYDEEASGYALVSEETPLPWGWREVTEEEGATIWGRGFTYGSDPERCGCSDPKAGGDQGAGCPGGMCRMARYAVHAMLVSLNVVDTPVGHTPPVGPSVQFSVTYNQRDSFQPQIFPYWNLGTRWTADWMAYVTDDPTNGAAPVKVYKRGGGQETYAGYNAGTSSYSPHRDSRAVVTRVSTSPIRYERRLPNGSVEEYGQPDGTLAYPRKVFLTRIIDAQGNALSLTYDAALRLVAATDALGQVTTLFYELETDPLRVTRVTDPFGRSALFVYDTQGRLAKITDVIGIESQFEYDSSDFMTALVTPYGRTTFRGGASGIDRWIEATDPLGGTEHVEYRNYSGDVPRFEPVSPNGVPYDANNFLNYRNTFYWSKLAFARAPGDRSKAQVFHWLHSNDGVMTSGTLESEKRPLERRVWYGYPGPLERRAGHPAAIRVTPPRRQ